MDALASSFISRHIRVRISTRRPVEFIDITDRVAGVVREHAVRAGLLNVQSLHTTAALVVNEHEPLLLEDFAAMLGRLVPIEAPYRHDAALAPVEDPAPEASRANGHAHCRSLVLSSAVCPERRRGPAAPGPLAARLPGRARWAARARTVGPGARGGWTMKVKMILPALTEATSPFWRPIKYSLFPPLGLATLAGYLSRRRRGRDPGRARRDARPRRSPGPRRHPGLHHLGAPRLPDSGSLPPARSARRAGRSARHVAARRGRGACGHDFSRAGRGYVAGVPRRLPAPLSGPHLSVGDSDARGAPAHSPRPHQAAVLPRAELDRRLARLSARL